MTPGPSGGAVVESPYLANPRSYRDSQPTFENATDILSGVVFILSMLSRLLLWFISRAWRVCRVGRIVRGLLLKGLFVGTSLQRRR